MNPIIQKIVASQEAKSDCTFGKIVVAKVLKKSWQKSHRAVVDVLRFIEFLLCIFEYYIHMLDLHC